jgi:hypothetical protein
VFKHKFWPDDSFDKYKVRWVVHDFTQLAGVDFGETFALVIKLGTSCTILTLAASKQCPFTSWTSPMRSSMTTSVNKCIATSPSGSSTSLSQTPSAPCQSPHGGLT